MQTDGTKDEVIRSWSSMRVEMEARKADLIIERRRQLDYDIVWGDGSYERMKRAVESGALEVYWDEREESE